MPSEPHFNSWDLAEIERRESKPFTGATGRDMVRLVRDVRLARAEASALREENARLRTALNPIAACADYHDTHGCLPSLTGAIIYEARAALRPAPAEGEP